VEDSRFLSGVEALELKDTAVVLRQVLFRMPGRGSERLQSTVTSESNSGSNVIWCINLIRESIISFCFLCPSCLQTGPTKNETRDVRREKKGEASKREGHL
jgi:hypothetical protein